MGTGHGETALNDAFSLQGITRTMTNVATLEASGHPARVGDSFEITITAGVEATIDAREASTSETRARIEFDFENRARGIPDVVIISR